MIFMSYIRKRIRSNIFQSTPQSWLCAIRRERISRVPNTPMTRTQFDTAIYSLSQSMQLYSITEPGCSEVRTA